MKNQPVKYIFIGGFVLLGLANLFVALLTLFVKAGKYGWDDLWQNPDSFAIGTSTIGLICLGVAYWFWKKP